jgi:hypothetical protein
MAKYFKGTHYLGTDNSSGIKAFGAKNGSQIVVMILNQDTVTTAAKPYKIRLDSSPLFATTWVKMHMGTFSTLYTDTIKASSTTILIFDCNGTISAKYRYEQTDPTNPFKSVWAAASPAVTYSVTLSGNDSICCSQFTNLFTATASSGPGTHTYQWYKNGSAVPGATSSTWTSPNVEFNPNTTNVVKCVMTTNTCTTEDEMIFKVGGGRIWEWGAPEETPASIVSLVPNPAAENVAIKFTVPESTKSADISIINLYGQIVQTHALKESGKLDIDCGLLKSGLYFTRLTVNGKIVDTKKLVISK